uniref:C2H2-type domain-containing protein n=1 Tax=Riboviria sp. TaxID=2585031 RepID=A0A8K1U2R4_9VIRU|nr:MAG: hypothetical protein 2 [Riboviria sp.]
MQASVGDSISEFLANPRAQSPAEIVAEYSPYTSLQDLIVPQSEGLAGRAKRVARVATKWLVISLSSLILLGLMVASVVGLLSGVVAGYFNLLSYQYTSMKKLVVQAFIPEPEPEPGYFEYLIENATKLVERVDKNLLAILLVVTAILVSLWVLSGFLIYSLRRMSMKARGVQFEAMRPGSAFVEGTIPKCQVQIMIPGLLMDSHQGYGIRVGSWMVVPLHVIGSLKEMLLVGPRGKLLVSTQFEESRLHPDVAYVYLEDRQWVTLGNASASTSPALNGYVRCTGMKGYSSGTIGKTRTNGVLKYAGSTISGMSGAAYIMGDKVLGMHTGAGGDFNLGVSTTLFVSELKYKTKKEAAYLPSKNNGEDAAFIKTTNTWTAKLMDELARDAALSTRDAGWSGSAEIDFDEQIEWDAATPAKKTNPIKLATVMMQQDQGVDGGETEYNLLSQKVIDDIEDLKARVKDVEDYIKADLARKEKKKEAKPVITFQCDRCPKKTTSASDLELHKKKHLKFKCSLCEVECQTEIKLANHEANAHKTVKGESAYPGDARVSVETTGPFLGKRSSSRQTRKKSSRPSSSSSERRRDSQPWELILNRMNESQKSIEKLCEAVLKATAGPSLATQQK